MTFDLRHIWATMSPVNKAIALSLVLMAVLAAAVTIERLIALGKSARVSRVFAQKAQPLIAAWRPSELAELARTHEASSLARLFGAMTRRYLEAESRGEGGLSPVDMARGEAARQQEALSADLRRGMSIIATVGSITPFVGLLGTVVGIIAAFQAIGSSGAGGLATVSVGIAEALIETALGLSVAIPAVIAFNYLSGRVAGIESALGRSAGQLIDEMEFNHGKHDSALADRVSDVHATVRAA
jgi:biopolymer transport protein ExbB